MNTRLPVRRGSSVWGALAVLSVLTLAPMAWGQSGGGKNPVGKLYIVAVEGEAQVAQGGRIETPRPKAMFVAQGAKIETKAKGNLTLVFSNGSGVFLDQETPVDVRRFTQEPFTASRTDLEREPSISHTEVSISHGTMAVSAAKLVAGSKMNSVTTLGSFSLREGNVVIQAESALVRFSLLVGEGTVNGGNLDLGGRVLRGGEQAAIRPGAPGQPNVIEIGPIPAADLATLEALAARAYAARKTVFFDTDADNQISASPVVPVTVPVEASISPSKLPN